MQSSSLTGDYLPYEDRRRLPYVDLAKCVALVLVICSHSEISFMIDGVDNIILPVFWICSGYTSSDYINLRKKSKLLFYYAFLSLICVLYCVFYLDLEVTSDRLLGIFYARYKIFKEPISVSNPCLLDLCNTVLWFLPSLFTAFCVFKVILKGNSFKSQSARCVVFLIIAWLFGFCPVLMPWSIDSAFIIAVFLCIGFWIRKYRLLQDTAFSFLISALLIYLCLDRFTWMTNPSLNDFGQHWPSVLVTATFGVVVLVLLCRYLDRTWLARTAVVFSKESLFIFGLSIVFASYLHRPLFNNIESWKIRMLILIASCFIGGLIAGKLYKLLVWLLRLSFRRVRTQTKNGT